MCNLNNLSLGISGANMLRNTFEGYAQNKANYEYQKARNSLIIANYERQARDANNSYAEAQRVNSIKKQQNYLQNLQAKSTLLAGKASSGVNGTSLDNLYRGYDRATAVNNYLYAKDLYNKGLSNNDRLSTLRASAVNSLTDLSKYRYSGASALLNGASDLFGGWGNYMIKRTKITELPIDTL